MTGESPLQMMRPAPARPQRLRGGAEPQRRRRWRVLGPVALIVLVGLGWSVAWYYAASIADRTMSGWVAREAAAGRVYSCGSQTIGGFPFEIVARCSQPSAAINSNQPSFTAKAAAVTFTAQVWRPTRLVGTVTGPVVFALTGQPPSFVASWSLARLTVRGLPPMPDEVSFTIDQPRVNRGADANGAPVFAADHADFSGRIIAGSPYDNPVIEAVARFNNAAAPTVHPLLAEPVTGDVDAVLRGFKDLAPKPWAARFREMQASGGSVEIKALRLEQPDDTVIGTGSLTVNEHGKLDGLIRVAVAGVDHIVPLLGVDNLISQGIDRLTGTPNQPGQGLNALDRLMPGLSGVVRETTNAGLIDNLNKMGQPTDIDKKPAIVLPLRLSDGLASLGMIPLGEVPPLF